MASAHVTGFIEKGTVNTGIRLPIFGVTIVIVIVFLGQLLKIHYRICMSLSAITCLVTLYLIHSGKSPIGSGVNIVQFMWYGFSILIVVIIFIMSLLILTGIINEDQFRKSKS
jgi:hypothetical protein